MRGEDSYYEQLSENYRFFLAWRQGSFAGYLIVLGALTSKAVDLNVAGHESWRWVAGLIAPIGLTFWLLDHRTRQLFRAAVETGRSMEEAAGVRGFFIGQDAIGTLPHKDKNYPIVSHSSIATTVYVATALISLTIAIYLKESPLK